MTIENNAEKLKPKMIIFSGIPGSGKSTEAKKLQEKLRAEGSMAVIINRDDLRTMLFGEDYHKLDPVASAESEVSGFERSLIRTALRRGWTVISDNTNIANSQKKGLKKLAEEYGAEVEEIPIIVELEVALERNKARGAAGGRLVPDEVIISIFERYNNFLNSKGKA